MQLKVSVNIDYVWTQLYIQANFVCLSETGFAELVISYSQVFGDSVQYEKMNDPEPWDLSHVRPLLSEGT